MLLNNENNVFRNLHSINSAIYQDKKDKKKKKKKKAAKQSSDSESDAKVSSPPEVMNCFVFGVF